MFGVARRFQAVRWGVCGMAAASALIALAQKPDAKATPTRRSKRGPRSVRPAKTTSPPCTRRHQGAIDFWTADGVYIDDTGQGLPARELLEKSADTKDEPHPATKMTETEAPFPHRRLGHRGRHVRGHDARQTARQRQLLGRLGASERQVEDRQRPRIADRGRFRADQLAELEPFVGEWTGRWAATCSA